MCGIVGYTGTQNATPILLEGLRRLEYRGYDSAGIAVLSENGAITVQKAAGKLDNLRSAVVPAESVSDYQPYYSINEQGWWLHRGPNARYAALR